MRNSNGVWLWLWLCLVLSGLVYTPVELNRVSIKKKKRLDHLSHPLSLSLLPLAHYAAKCSTLRLMLLLFPCFLCGNQQNKTEGNSQRWEGDLQLAEFLRPHALCLWAFQGRQSILKCIYTYYLSGIFTFFDFEFFLLGICQEWGRIICNLP